jgi:hypothetical protein
VLRCALSTEPPDTVFDILIEVGQYLRRDQLGDLLEGVGLIEVASQYLL